MLRDMVVVFRNKPVLQINSLLQVFLSKNNNIMFIRSHRLCVYHVSEMIVVTVRCDGETIYIFLLDFITKVTFM